MRCPSRAGSLTHYLLIDWRLDSYVRSRRTRGQQAMSFHFFISAFVRCFLVDVDVAMFRLLVLALDTSFWSYDGQGL